MTCIAFVGLGKMGGPIATNLSRAVPHIKVYDRNPAALEQLRQAGATPCGSLLEAANGAEVVFLSLPGPREVNEVLLGAEGIASRIARGAVVVDLSTNAVASVRDLAQRLQSEGISFLDCPISGGVGGAASGKLAIWAAGDAQAFQQVLPLLQAIGDDVRYIGASGAASVAKLVHNAAANLLNSAFSEIFSLGIKAGLDADTLYDTIKSGALGRRLTFDGLPQQFLRNSYEPVGFEVDLARKDLTLAVELGREVDVPLRFVNMALQDLVEASARGWGRADFRKAMTLQLERAGVEIAAKA